MLPLAMVGCVAKSEHVDRLSQQVAKNAQVTVALAESHAELAVALEVPETARQADRLVGLAQAQADRSAEIAETPSAAVSPSSLSGLANGLLTGNWMEVGASLLALAGAGFGVQQRRKAMTNSKLAEEVAEMPPEQARARMKQAKG